MAQRARLRGRAAIFTIGALVVAGGLLGSPTVTVPAAAGTASAAPVFVNTQAVVVASARTPSERGYWLAFADGTVVAFGDARNRGSVVARAMRAPIVAMAATATGSGYSVIDARGRIFTFGDAHSYGSTAAIHLVAPIVAMALTPSAKGYWFVAADGGVFAFGDARYYGSTFGARLSAPIVAIAASPDGRGYWLAGRDGGVFTFGSAVGHGSAWGKLGGAYLTALTPTANGYFATSSAGRVIGFGDAGSVGDAAGLGASGGIRSMISSATGRGYLLVSGRGAVLPYGDAVWHGTVVRRREVAAGPPHVDFFGDSLVSQAHNFTLFASMNAGLQATVADYPGSALCDFLPGIAQSARSHPSTTVMAFSGNRHSPCINGATLSNAAVLANYRSATTIATALLDAEGTIPVFALGPPFRGEAPATNANEVYTGFRAAWPGYALTYDAGALLAGPNRSWVKTLNCLSFEGRAQGCVAGKITVRAGDTVHFCPGALVDPSDWRSGCRLWSSGAWRYAAGLVRAAELGLR